MTSAKSTTCWCSTIFSQEISDTEKTNLRDFVEAGKGIVVLHHAIADYQDWEWWYKEVVGGKYLLKPEGSMPASTYLHDQEECVKVVGKAPHHGAYRSHAPVGRNLQGNVDFAGRESAAPHRCSHQRRPGGVDQPLYKIARRVHPTRPRRNRASLPAYRTLVQDAIRWSAGRLN